MYCVFRQVDPFVKGETNGNCDPCIKKAVLEAEKALLMSMKEREDLIKCVPSDEEDGDDDEEKMEVDAADEGNCQRNDSDSSDDDDDIVTGKRVSLISRVI